MTPVKRKRTNQSSTLAVRGGGEVYWGTPARPLKDYLEAQANVARLPALRREVAELKARLTALEKQPEPKPE